MPNESRRHFLKVIATAPMAAAAAGSLTRCDDNINPSPSVTVGEVDQAGQLKIAPSQIAELQQVGGSALLASSNFGTPILAFHQADGSLGTVSGLCTHVGCPLGYVPSHSYIECPCHGSRFNLNGQVLRAPAVAPLFHYTTRIEAQTGNWVINTKSSDDRFTGVMAGKIELQLQNIPELNSTGATLAYTPAGLNGPILIVHTDVNIFNVSDATCTYQPCIIDYDTVGKVLRCPCHNDTYDLATGRVTSTGPATVALKIYPVQYDSSSQILTITVSSSP